MTKVMGLAAWLLLWTFWPGAHVQAPRSVDSLPLVTVATADLTGDGKQDAVIGLPSQFGDQAFRSIIIGREPRLNPSTRNIVVWTPEGKTSYRFVEGTLRRVD